MWPSRGGIAFAAAVPVAFALAWQATALSPPARAVQPSPPEFVALVDGRPAYETSLPTVNEPAAAADPLAWVNAFRSEEPGPEAGAAVRVNLEGAPSPREPGALLLRVSVQARHVGPEGAALKEGRLTVSFYGSEVATWSAGDQLWQPPSALARYQLDEVLRGQTRTVFLQVDATGRFGGSLGVVELTGVDGVTGAPVRLRAPLQRGAVHPLARASPDFRFLTAVWVAAEAVRTPHHLALFEIIDVLVSDTAPGIAERERFVSKAVPIPSDRARFPQLNGGDRY